MVLFYYPSAGISRRRPVSVCLSHAGIVSTRLNAGSPKQRHVIDKRRYFPDANSRWWATPPPLKFALKVTHPLLNDLDRYPLIVPQPWELEKKFQSSLIGSRQCAFRAAIDEPCALPLSTPKHGSKREFLHFALQVIRHVKFGIEINHSKSQLTHDKLSLNRVRSRHVIH